MYKAAGPEVSLSGAIFRQTTWNIRSQHIVLQYAAARSTCRSYELSIGPLARRHYCGTTPKQEPLSISIHEILQRALGEDLEPEEVLLFDAELSGVAV